MTKTLRFLADAAGFLLGFLLGLAFIAFFVFVGVVWSAMQV